MLGFAVETVERFEKSEQTLESLDAVFRQCPHQLSSEIFGNLQRMRAVSDQVILTTQFSILLKHPLLSDVSAEFHDSSYMEEYDKSRSQWLNKYDNYHSGIYRWYEVCLLYTSPSPRD